MFVQHIYISLLSFPSKTAWQYDTATVTTDDKGAKEQSESNRKSLMFPQQPVRC